MDEESETTPAGHGGIVQLMATRRTFVLQGPTKPVLDFHRAHPSAASQHSPPRRGTALQLQLPATSSMTSSRSSSSAPFFRLAVPAPPPLFHRRLVLFARTHRAPILCIASH